MRTDRKDYAHQYYLKNKRKICERTKKWRESNKERMSLYLKEWQKVNKDRVRESQKRHYHKHPDRSKERQLKREYGISREVYERKFSEQEGKCAVCGKALRSSFSTGDNSTLPLAGVDHNHNTGQVRGLLCISCNAGIGNFQESTEFLQRAILYLKKYS